MYPHVSVYAESVAQLTDTDINAAADDVLQVRNNHLIVSDPMNLIAALAFGSTLDRLRFGNISLNTMGRNHIYPMNVSSTIPSNPQLDDRRRAPMALPIDEELTILATTNAAGPAITGAVLFIAPPEWSPVNAPPEDAFYTRATATIAAASTTTWSALAAMAFDVDLQGGVYEIFGGQVVLAGALAWRLRVPRLATTNGRQLRPGGVIQNALSHIPLAQNMGGFGSLGKFQTFEIPQLQTFGSAAGGTADITLWLRKTGERW